MNRDLNIGDTFYIDGFLRNHALVVVFALYGDVIFVKDSDINKVCENNSYTYTFFRMQPIYTKSKKSLLLEKKINLCENELKDILNYHFNEYGIVSGTSSIQIVVTADEWHE